MTAVSAAHLYRRRKPTANSGPAGLTKNPAALLVIKLDAAHAGRLAMGHARNRRADGRRDAAGAAARSTVNHEYVSTRFRASGRQPLRCEKHLINHGLHILPACVIEQLTLGIKRIASTAESEGLGRHPALHVQQQGHEMAL